MIYTLTKHMFVELLKALADDIRRLRDELPAVGLFLFRLASILFSPLLFVVMGVVYPLFLVNKKFRAKAEAEMVNKKS